MRDGTGWFVQSDQKATQPILKYLLMVAVQYNSTGLINTHIAVTIQEPTQVTSCCNLLAPVRQLSLNSRSARMSFSQVQRAFIVEDYLASRSYLTCQNEFRDTFPDSPVPNKSTISRLVNRFRSLQKFFNGLHQTWEKEWMHASLNAVDIFTTLYNIAFFLVSDFSVIYFLTNRTCVRKGLRDFSNTLYNESFLNSLLWNFGQHFHTRLPHLLLPELFKYITTTFSPVHL
jgi:hypothetical protein